MDQVADWPPLTVNCAVCIEGFSRTTLGPIVNTPAGGGTGAAGLSVTVADALFDGSAWLVAVIVMV
jgi:hypothetical protein